MDACAQLRAAAVGKVTEIDGVHLNQRPVALRVRSESRGLSKRFMLRFSSLRLVLVQRVLVTADLPSWDLRTYTTHRGYPIGPAELRARSDYLQTANPLLSVLTYSLSLSRSLSHPTYREHGIKRCIHDPSTISPPGGISERQVNPLDGQPWTVRDGLRRSKPPQLRRPS